MDPRVLNLFFSLVLRDNKHRHEGKERSNSELRTFVSFAALGSFWFNSSLLAAQPRYALCG
jgi:hypothetical protein